MTDTPAARARLEHDGQLLRLTLARPKANIVDGAMIGALQAALIAHRNAPRLKAVLLDHDGPHFSFGASIEEHFPDQMAGMLKALHGLLTVMLDFPAAILVAARGQCLGGGLEVAAAGSLIFAAPDAKFGQPEIKLAVFAPAASCLLPARLPQAHAESLLLSGRSIGADDARAMGLIEAIADDPAAAAEAWFVQHLKPHSAAALRIAQRAAREDFARRVKERFAFVEHLCIDELLKTADCLEGLTAFVEKRPAVWTDR